MLRIAEIFPSLQGEGLRMGEPTLFIRLAGCNLRCDFCDTRSAWRGGTCLSVQEVLDRLAGLKRRFPCRWVCLTGGEPLLQDVAGLIRSLRRKGFRVQVETNGTVGRRLSADWITVSPKPPNYRSAPGFRNKASEVKLVVTRRLSFRDVRAVRRAFPPKTPLLLQPQSNLTWSIRRGWRLINQCLAAGLPNVRLSLQAHKAWKLP